LTGPDGSLFAFEPDPRNVSALESNVRANRLANVSVIKQAVSDSSRDVTFASFSYSLVSHIANPTTPSDAELLTVSAMSLDDFVYGEGHPIPSFLKVDVEGEESSVFHGATRLLDEVRPTIVAEVRRGVVWQEISTLMGTFGYRDGGEAGLTKKGLADILFFPREPEGRKAPKFGTE
jgi:FkbM family methyltransferase